MWYNAISAISLGSGMNFKRKWALWTSSSSCREMHPRQVALHAGDAGTGHSQRFKKKFWAARQL